VVRPNPQRTRGIAHGDVVGMNQPEWSKDRRRSRVVERSRNLGGDGRYVVPWWSILRVIGVEQIQPDRRRPQEFHGSPIFVATKANGIGRVGLVGGSAVVSVMKDVGGSGHGGHDRDRGVRLHEMTAR